MGPWKRPGQERWIGHVFCVGMWGISPEKGREGCQYCRVPPKGMMANYCSKSAVLLFAFLCCLNLGEAFKCFECALTDGDHLCSPLGLFGEPVQCSEGVTTCYKGFTVESKNKITRSCGRPHDKPDPNGECPMVHEDHGQDRKLSCHCSTELCNTVHISAPILTGLLPASFLFVLQMQ